jgi:hypothetical protein
VVVEVHTANTANETLAVFHHILDALGVPFVSKLNSELHCFKKISAIKIH